MFGSLGGMEIVVIFVLALLLFGPRKLPEIGRMVGKTVGEFRKATHEFRTSLEREVEMEKVRETGRDLREAGRELQDAARVPAAGGRALLDSVLTPQPAADAQPPAPPSSPPVADAPPRQDS